MIYIVTSRDHDVLRPDVAYVNEWSNGPAVSVRFGASGLYLDPATARQLAADILAALPEDGLLPGGPDEVAGLRTENAALLAVAESAARYHFWATGDRTLYPPEKVAELLRELGQAVAAWERCAPAPCPDCALGACTVDHGGAM